MLLDGAHDIGRHPPAPRDHPGAAGNARLAPSGLQSLDQRIQISQRAGMQTSKERQLRALRSHLLHARQGARQVQDQRNAAA